MVYFLAHNALVSMENVFPTTSTI